MPKRRRGSRSAAVDHRRVLSHRPFESLVDEALATITIDAAKILGIDNRVGSLAVGKDGDLALYDGDPFEYTSHCTGVIINVQVVSETSQ